MRSVVLVGLQFLLIAVLAWPRHAWTWAPLPIAFIGAAILLGAAALVVNRPGNFNIRPDPKTGGRLVRTGPYRYVRHPMYLAVLLGCLGLFLEDPAWWRAVALVTLVIVLHLKADIEERALQRLHPEYRVYAQRTARLVPFLW